VPHRVIGITKRARLRRQVVDLLRQRAQAETSGGLERLNRPQKLIIAILVPAIVRSVRPLFLEAVSGAEAGLLSRSAST